MKIGNNIGWCDATTNAVTGCDKVSPGCKNCYAEAGTRARVLRAQGHETWGVKGERVPVNFEPVFRRLNKQCTCDYCHEAYSWRDGDLGGCSKFVPSGKVCGGTLRRIRLFADSNSDWLDPRWPVETLARFLDAIRFAPNVNVQLLTKRIELFKSRICEALVWAEPVRKSDAFYAWLARWLDGKPPPNIWLGVSVEDQKRADERVPLLLKTPAAVRFLSVEPLLEPVELFGIQPDWNWKTPLGEREVQHTSGEFGDCVVPDWIIVGGESGKNRRDCGVRSLESIYEQCAAAGVPCYVKQDSDLMPGQRGRLSEAAWASKEFPQ